jgi:hypothetical protein
VKKLVYIPVLLLALAACTAAPGSSGMPADPGSPSTTAPAEPGATTTTTEAALHPQNGATVWSTPAAGLATSPRSAEWAQRIYDYADTRDHTPSVEFGFDPPSSDYSVPIYSADDATTTIRVFRRPFTSWPGRFDVALGGRIPWNPSWLPADGNDGHLTILNFRTGEEWDLWGVATPTFHPAYLTQVECATNFDNLLAGYDMSTDLCAGAAVRITEPSGAVADVRSYRGNYPWSTEIGIQQSIGLATPAEVAAGRIPHALRFEVSSTMSMTGPACPADVTGPDDPRVGSTCGIALAPGGQFDSRDTVSSPAQLSKMVPRGTRFVIDMTDAQIDQWLDARGYTGTLRSTARVFAVALRDYGLIQVMTTGGSAIIPVSGARNPATASGWRSLGIADDGGHLLDGLITASRIRVLEPPTNHCGGVATKLACWSSDTSY